MNKPVHPTTWTTKVLMFLVQQEGKWCTWGPSTYMPSVQQVFPVGTKEGVQHRFMAQLQRKGFVGGCDCGCRGDYAVTPLGLETLAKDCVTGESDARNYLINCFPFAY